MILGKVSHGTRDVRGSSLLVPVSVFFVSSASKGRPVQHHKNHEDVERRNVVFQNMRDEDRDRDKERDFAVMVCAPRASVVRLADHLDRGQRQPQYFEE